MGLRRDHALERRLHVLLRGYSRRLLDFMLVVLLLEEPLAHVGELLAHLLIEVIQQMKHDLRESTHQFLWGTQVLKIGAAL